LKTLRQVFIEFFPTIGPVSASDHQWRASRAFSYLISPKIAVSKVGSIALSVDEQWTLRGKV
jgi:hypothetical protein